ncbi:MAG: NUDIX domain-containing protein [Zetaproteobacteria bacterium]|nr:NUDIX domain-containing protein [Zetaproteobacteria bacterium]
MKKHNKAFIAIICIFAQQLVCAKPRNTNISYWSGGKESSGVLIEGDPILRNIIVHVGFGFSEQTPVNLSTASETAHIITHKFDLTHYQRVVLATHYPQDQSGQLNLPLQDYFRLDMVGKHIFKEISEAIIDKLGSREGFRVISKGEDSLNGFSKIVLEFPHGEDKYPHSGYAAIGAHGLIMDKQQNILVGIHNMRVSIVGGSGNPKESPLDTLAREMKEETGLQLILNDKQFYLKGPRGNKAPVRVELLKLASGLYPRSGAVDTHVKFGVTLTEISLYKFLGCPEPREDHSVFTTDLCHNHQAVITNEFEKFELVHGKRILQKKDVIMSDPKLNYRYGHLVRILQEHQDLGVTIGFKYNQEKEVYFGPQGNILKLQPSS